MIANSYLGIKPGTAGYVTSPGCSPRAMDAIKQAILKRKSETCPAKRNVIGIRKEKVEQYNELFRRVGGCGDYLMRKHSQIYVTRSKMTEEEEESLVSVAWGLYNIEDEVEANEGSSLMTWRVVMKTRLGHCCY